MTARRYLHTAVFLATLCIVGCDSSGTPEEKLETMTRKVAEKFDDVPQLSTEKLATWLADPDRQPPQLLDTREPEEFAVSHLPGAIRIDPDASTKQILSKIDSERPVVTYCSVGYRSSKIAARLLKTGTPNVINLEGSIFKWANEGRPLVRHGRPVQRVHPYSSRYAEMLHPNLRSEP